MSLPAPRFARYIGIDVSGNQLCPTLFTPSERQGATLPAIMHLTEHRAVSIVIGYFQTGGASANPAARLLED